MMDWLKKLWSRWFGKQAEPPPEPHDPPELEDAPVVDTPLDTGEDPVSIAQSALEVDEPEAPDVPASTRAEATAIEVQETARESPQPLEPDDPPAIEQAPAPDIPEPPRMPEATRQEPTSKPSLPRAASVDPYEIAGVPKPEPVNFDPGMTPETQFDLPDPPELDRQDPRTYQLPADRQPPPTTDKAATSDTPLEQSNPPAEAVREPLSVAPLPKTPHTTPEFTSMAAAGLDVPEIRGTRPSLSTSSTTPQNRPERQTVQSDANPPEARQSQAEQATEAPEATIQPPPDPETFQPVEQDEVVFEELNQQQRREDTQTARQQKQRDRQLAVTNQARQRKGMAPLPAETDAPDAEPPEPADVPAPPRSQTATQPPPQLPAESGPEVESGGSGEVVRVLEEIRDLLEENRELAEAQVDAIQSLKEALKNVGGLA